MIYRIGDMGDADTKVVQLLNDYFIKELKLDVLYKRYGKLNISKVHPFTRMLSNTRNNRPKDVLPAVSIALVDDTSINIALNKNTQIVEIDSALLRELKNQKYPLNRENVFDELNKIIKDGGKVFSNQKNRRYAQKLVIEIWTTNDIIKGIIYEGVKDFIDFYEIDLYNFGMENLVINGKKDGDFNFDFGDVLYGAQVILSYNIANMIFYVDTDWKQITAIDHTADDINVTPAP